MTSMYQRTIMEVCTVDTTEARYIESIMRDQFHTLDGLSRTAFKKAARAAKEALKDPALRKLMVDYCKTNTV